MAIPAIAKQFPLPGVEIAWLLGISKPSTTVVIANPDGSVAGDVATRFLFNTLKGNPTVAFGDSASSSSEKHEINVGEDILEFGYTVSRRSGTETEDDGTTPKLITSTEDNGTGKFKVTLNVNGADKDSESWIDFLIKLHGMKDGTFLVVVPTDITYDRKAGGLNANGYYYCIMQFNTAISMPSIEAAPANLTLELLSVESDMLTGTSWHATFAALDWASGTISKIHNSSVAYQPVALESGSGTTDMELLAAGDVVIKKVT
jgi:hypothetical protein